MQLRDYQQQVIKDLYNYFRMGKRRALVFAPTGAGKSIMIARVVKDALSRGKRVLIIAHRKKLVSQLAEAISRFCSHVCALIAPGKKSDYSNQVQVAMAQTLQRRELPESIDILISDETHITSYFEVWRKCLDAYCGKIWALSKAFVIGFTATPWRTSHKQGYCHLFDCVVKAPSTRELVRKGYLTNPRLYGYKPLIDTNSLTVDGSGDYTISSLSRACGDEYNSDVIDKWESVCSDKKTIVFCASVKQARTMRKLLYERGYKSALVIGSDSNKWREQVFTQFKQDVIQLLVSVSTLTEGYDETSIECVLIARPTRSAALITQMVGRGMRLHEGKKEVFIIDCGECFDWIVGSKLKGFKVEDPIDLNFVPLCPTAKPGIKIKEKDCIHCNKPIPIFARVCPHCENEIPLKQKAPPNIIEFPEIEEIFTKQGRKQYNWLRKEMAQCFQTIKDPSGIFNKFHRKFGYLPPYDWFLGSIFNCENQELNIGVYRHYLTVFKLTPDIIDFMIDLEFGKHDRSYKLPGGVPYQRTIEYQSFNPAEYLKGDRKCAYNNKLSYSTRFATNYAYNYLTS